MFAKNWRYLWNDERSSSPAWGRHPVGLTAVESWQAVKDGVCGIAPITQFDPSDMKVKLAAEVKGFRP